MRELAEQAEELMVKRVQELRDEFGMSRSKTYDLEVKEYVARMDRSCTHCQRRTGNGWIISWLTSSAYPRRNVGSYT